MVGLLVLSQEGAGSIPVLDTLEGIRLDEDTVSKAAAAYTRWGFESLAFRSPRPSRKCKGHA